MKELQCTICGGSIIELDDKHFECESCGNKFNKSDLSKISKNILNELSEISKEIELKNIVIRADHFFDNKDYSNANDYYNKALDIDAKYKHCLERLESIKKHKEKIEVSFVDSYLNSKDCIDFFLHQLKFYKGIPTDIYEKINIVSVNEKYYQFRICSYDISGSFTATAIDIFDDGKPWNGRYKASQKNKVYCQSKYLINRKIEASYEDFNNIITKMYSPEEYQQLSNFNTIQIDNNIIDLSSQARDEANRICELNAQESIKETSIKKLAHINLKHEDYVFNFKEIYLPFCEIKYDYEDKEYYWLMSLNDGNSICSGTYPHINQEFINTSSDFDKIYLKNQENTAEKITNIDSQLEVLEKRIENINKEKFEIENKMLQQIKKPWYFDIGTTLFLYVPFMAIIGFILKGIFGLIGVIVLIVAAFMVLFCLIVFIRNLIINKNSLEAQRVYNEEQKSICEKEEKLISKINETKNRLQQERSEIIERFENETEKLQQQHSNPIFEEIARKLTYDCFAFNKNNNNKNIGYYSLPNWIIIRQSGSVSKLSQNSKHIKSSNIKETRSVDTEIQRLYNKLSK